MENSKKIISIKNHIDELSIRYNIPPDELEVLIAFSRQYDLHIYDTKILFDKYKKEKYVKEHIDERNYLSRVKKWLEGDYHLDNSDRFKIAANTYINTNKYTNAIKNKHPNSAYKKFWFEEARRCIYGYLSGDEWISGYNYFYLNYAPIELVKTLNDFENDDGRLQGERITDFPFFWDGDMFYFQYLEEAERKGLSAMVLKTRGRGYSWKAAAMMNRNFYLIPRSRSIIYAGDDEYLAGGDGVLTKCWSQMSFLDTYTAWTKKKQKKDTERHKRASMIKIVDGTEIESGFMSEIIGKTLHNDASKARGRRAKLILYEEGGSFKHLIESWIISGPSVMQGRITYGLRVAFGTGGDANVGFEGLRKLYYQPDAYKVYSLPNMWTPGAMNNKVGWFQPEYINREGYYDKDGNSDMNTAREDILKERDILVSSGADIDTLLRTKAEQPIVPEEAVLRTTGSPFPRAMLKEHFINLTANKDILGDTYRGKLIIDPSGKIVWLEDINVTIIESHKSSKLNREGGIEIYSKPIETIKEQLYGYIIGVDPVDFDYAEVREDSFSLGSCFVFNTITNRIVAEYTGRPDLADTFYENVRRLGLYYNAQVMYENNIKGLYTYFVNKYSEQMLAFKPKILDDGDTLISSGRRRYGYTANERINKMGLQLIKKWLIQPVDPENTELKNLHTIKSKGLIDELIEWNPDGNFDRVSSMIALMIFYKDIERMISDGLTTTKEDSSMQFFKKPFKYK